MNVKDYLEQAKYLDMRINSKVEQLSTLNDLATKCTVTLSDMPRNPNKGTSSMEDTIIKIIGLQEEINRDIDNLVDLKREIMEVIKKVENVEYQTILENRYLSFMSWEKIAVEMKYSIQQIYRLRDKAQKEVEKILVA
ncbi:DUF1492 domain-containing protein [uncultured Granulicatella sp.]|jgi:DNA-directed RNA polymerase specialized sigma subunit|uniref:DUF1492 domain-containing protein n=1 Tax=uncultured Granulicatella sp. TaxID=316089 RepID=UPI0028D81EEB|nr:DUF1492 domain-containing protein [uncultured Granulicatella sp.]